MDLILISLNVLCICLVLKRVSGVKPVSQCANYRPVINSNISKIEELTELLFEDIGDFTKEDLVELLDAATSGWWVWNIETGYDYLSRGWCEQLGYTQDELPHHVDTWKRLIHPDDMPSAEAAMGKHLVSGEPYKLTARYKHKDGEWITQHDAGKVIKFKNGKPLIMVGHETEVG